MKKTITLASMCCLFVGTLFAQTKLEVNKIRSGYDTQKLKRLETNFKEKAVSEKSKALEFAKNNNIETKMITKDGRMLELQRVVNGKPIYYSTFNVAAAESTRANHLQSGGSLGLNLMGQNMTAYVWDGGVANASHQEYDGSGGNNRFSIGDGSSTLNFHAEHVTGTIIASGYEANAEGMAPQASAIGSDWNDDKAEATFATSNGMLLSNHSYGYAVRNSLGQVQLNQYFFGGYIDESRDWDEIMFNAPNYLMVVAAGNDGEDDTAVNNPTGGAGWDKLTGHSTSKNNLVVANAQDAIIDDNGNLISVIINSSSSEGPTDDMRIKPDITGNGTDLYSSFNLASYDSTYGTNLGDGNINDDYASITGTSMASPNVTGSLLLLQQHYNNLNGSYMKAATLKGLALHTADDAGVSGPDAVFGWGLLNAKEAAEIITEKDTGSEVKELTLTSGETYSITVNSDGVNPLLASISWTDRAGTAVTSVNSTTPVLVNDLDIRVTQAGTSYLPYMLTGPTTSVQQDNIVDPYERVDVIGATGEYTITVTHKGTLVGGSQNYSLIISGLSSTPVICNATVPTNVIPTNVSDTEAIIFWDAVPGATYDVRYRAVGATSWTTNSIAGSSTTLTGLSVLTDYEVQVRSNCDLESSAYSSSVNFSTLEVQINYCTSNGNNVSDEYIGRVEIGSIDNSTGASSNGYGDYTSISTDLIKGEVATITVTPTWTGTVYGEGYSVFIDYNKDGDFEDAGETVWTQTVTQTTPVSGAFTVPTSAVTGTTTMRVVMQYNAVPPSCGAFDYGETEDYTVNLTTGIADTVAPVITLVGASTINLEVGDTYTELGATAEDDIDGNITSSIVITGTVDTTVAGTYTIYYNVSDVAGNEAAEVTRTVIITESLIAGPNLALGKNTDQSTTTNNGDDSRAVDGNTNGNWNAGSVTHTASGIGEWWLVELGGTYPIGDIDIYNRINCCTFRSDDITVTVEDDNENVLWSQNITSSSAATLMVNAGGVSGSVIRITQNQDYPLSLAEVEVYAYEGTASVFPDPSKKYYIDSAYFDSRIAATGESEEPYTTSTSTTGADVEWVFVDKGNGYWHIQRAAGGSLPRLRTDNSQFADMQGTAWTGSYTYYELTEGYIAGSYFVTLPDGPASYRRLQINSTGVVRMVSEAQALTWESFTFTEVNNVSSKFINTAEEIESKDSLASTLSFDIYPNPAKDVLNINLSGSESTYKIEIMDMIGKTHISKSIVDANATIDVAKLNSGLYLVQLYDGDTVVKVKKFIKE